MSDKTRRDGRNTPQTGDVFRCCGKSDGHASWCISTARMLAGESVTYTPVTRHAVTIDEDDVTGQSEPKADPPEWRYRWSCSCGKNGRWVSRRLQAQQGGATHQRGSG